MIKKEDAVIGLVVGVGGTLIWYVYVKVSGQIPFSGWWVWRAFDSIIMLVLKYLIPIGVTFKALLELQKSLVKKEIEKLNVIVERHYSYSSSHSDHARNQIGHLIQKVTRLEKELTALKEEPKPSEETPPDISTIILNQF